MKMGGCGCKRDKGKSSNYGLKKKKKSGKKCLVERLTRKGFWIIIDQRLGKQRGAKRRFFQRERNGVGKTQWKI